jgi:hypothetical protein
MIRANGEAIEFDPHVTQQSAEAIRSFDQIPDIMTMSIPSIEYLVDGMISRGTITLWTGTDGTAKTFLAQKMAIAVATGGEFLGRHCQRGPVLYLDYENPSFAVRARLDVMAGGPIPRLKVWGTWLDQQPPQICNELLLTIAKETKPLIVIDPFRYSHGAEENDSTAMMGIMQMLRYCASAGGAVVILHHPAKTEGSTGRGSTAIKGAVDVSFLQEMSDETGLITLTCTKNRFGERHSVTIRADFEEGSFTVTDSPQFTKRASEMDTLLSIIQQNPGLSQNAVCEKAGGKKSRVIAMLKAGRDSRLWEGREQGRAVLYFPLVPRTGNHQGTKGTGQGSKVVPRFPLLKGGNREPSPYETQLSVPEPGTQRTGAGGLPSCKACGSFALYPEKDGSLTCATCNGKVLVHGENGGHGSSVGSSAGPS